MNTSDKIKVTVEATINAPVEKVWKCWTETNHIVNWNNASDDWHSPKAESEFKVGGKFSYRMEAKDGSFGFDFAGIFDHILVNEQMDYTLGDGRQVFIVFKNNGSSTHISQTFEAETENTIELQKGGWQAILNNFKKYVEAN